MNIGPDARAYPRRSDGARRAPAEVVDLRAVFAWLRARTADDHEAQRLLIRLERGFSNPGDVDLHHLVHLVRRLQGRTTGDHEARRLLNGFRRRLTLAPVGQRR
jgi:hypothetical protein